MVMLLLNIIKLMNLVKDKKVDQINNDQAKINKSLQLNVVVAVVVVIVVGVVCVVLFGLFL